MPINKKHQISSLLASY